MTISGVSTIYKVRQTNHNKDLTLKSQPSSKKLKYRTYIPLINLPISWYLNRQITTRISETTMIIAVKMLEATIISQNTIIMSIKIIKSRICTKKTWMETKSTKSMMIITITIISIHLRVTMHNSIKMIIKFKIKTRVNSIKMNKILNTLTLM